MWSKIFLAIIGVTAGNVISVAVLSLATGVGIYPRLLDKSHTAKHILAYECVAGLGVVLGSIVTVYQIRCEILGWALPIVGFFIGSYVGCFIMALTEVLKAYPILFRRLKIKEGLPILIALVAIGKMIGSMYYFIYEMWK